jgi:O-antigen ligase
MTFFAGFVLMCALSLANPLFGIINYIMIYQVNPTTSWWGRPMTELGIRFSMTAAVFLFFGMAVNWGRLNRVRPLICLWQLLLILLVGIAALSRLTGVEVTDWPTEVMIEKFAKLAVFVLCLTHLVSDRQSFNVLLWTLVVGSLVLGYDAYTAPPDEFLRGRLSAVGGPDFRASSGLAAHMAAMLPLIGVALMATRNWKWRILALVAGAFSVNTIILCRTRSAFVALIVGAIAAVLLAPQARRFRIYMAILIAAISSNALTDQYFWMRMETLQDKEYLAKDEAATLRKRVWAAGMVMIADRPQGVGCGNFTRVIGRYDPEVKYRASHNTFLVCCAELGVHGALIFLLIILVTIGQLRECKRMAARSRDPPGTVLMVYGITLSMIIYFAAGLFTERFYVESFWWVMAMPTCLVRAVRREIAEDALVPELAATPVTAYAREWLPVPAAD